MGIITYQEAEKYILEIPKFAGKNTLTDTRDLLYRLTAAMPGEKIIHVAGTNGKGSVCAYLCSILKESGYQVGLFSSPHLVCMRERISIGNEWISEEEFARVFQLVYETVMEGKKEGICHPSFYEYLFLMAMTWFGERQPDYVILETGLGGRLDATNCIEEKAVSVITSIGYDHMQYLGDTLEEIAGEKAGIMRAGVPVVFADNRQQVTDKLTECARILQCPVKKVGKEDIFNVNIGNKTIDFSLHTGYDKYDNVFLNTSAPYQIQNASLAVVTAESLKGAGITAESIKKGLSCAYWPGRMEEIDSGVFVDGAHNEDGIEAFLQAVSVDRCRGRRRLIFGVADDKQYEKMIAGIVDSGLFAEAAVTRLESPRSVSIDVLKQVWRQYQMPCRFYERAEAAYQDMLMHMEREDRLYIVGSLYLIGQIKAMMKEQHD